MRIRRRVIRLVEELIARVTHASAAGPKVLRRLGILEQESDRAARADRLALLD